MTDPDDDILLARVGVPWWLWKEAESSVRLDRDGDGQTYTLDEEKPAE